MCSLLILGLVGLVGLVGGIPIDNGLDGEPEVQCGADSVQFSFSARNEFQGVVYAKNFFADEGCRAPATGGSGGGITLGFDTCNVRRFRSLDPRGVFVTLTVVVQFHSSVLTKVDRAFHIRCFYMEADKTMDAALEVSMVTTDLVTLTVPMPVCRYDICAADGNGNLLGGECTPVRFALIGDKIVHKWTCDTETLDTFCMEVYGCFVDDTQGGPPLLLVDDEGCSLDGNLVPNPVYPADLMAEAPSHVFKYADRPALYFNCQVRIGVAEPGALCADWRASQGPAGGDCLTEPLTLGRRKRSVALRRGPAPPGVEEVDLAPEFPLFVADLELTADQVPRALQRSLNGASGPISESADECGWGAQQGFLVLLIVFLVLVSGGLGGYLLFSKRR